MRLHFLVFIAFLSSASAAYAGAWLQPQYHGLAIAQATYYSSDHYFDAEGTSQKQPRFHKYELQPYVEYGLRDNLTLGGSIYLDRVTQSGNENHGLADPEIFARTRLWHSDKAVLSLQPLVKFSSYFVDDSPPRGGSKSSDAELSLLYGRNVEILSTRDYLDARMGYRTRDSSLADQWRMDLALGLSPTPKWQIIPAVRASLATHLADASTTNPESGDSDARLWKAEITGIYHLNETQWLQTTLFSHVHGEQTGAGYGASVGLAQRF